MKVGVIMGGLSSEREISLLTGQEMVSNLDKSKYEVHPIVIDNKLDLINKSAGIDVALLALHGKYGEDGTVQATLDSMGIPYTGCGVLSSSVCMDKDMTKKLLRFEGVATGDWGMLGSMDELDGDGIKRLGFPLVVKPNLGGSSIGTRIARNAEELKEAVKDALQWDSAVMVEQFIGGDEITCPIINGEMLPVVAIKPSGEFFDYTSKYEDGAADERVVELPSELHAKVEAAALASYKALKCSVYARIDMIIKDGIPYVLEINTLPGLTKNSLLPKSAAAAGIPFSQLLDQIISYSLAERQADN